MHLLVHLLVDSTHQSNWLTYLPKLMCVPRVLAKLGSVCFHLDVRLACTNLTTLLSLPYTHFAFLCEKLVRAASDTLDDCSLRWCGNGLAQLGGCPLCSCLFVVLFVSTLYALKKRHRQAEMNNRPGKPQSISGELATPILSNHPAVFHG